MNSIRKIIAVFIIICTYECVTMHRSSAQVNVSFQLFYDDLSPYGQWVDYANSGYVWIPNAGPGFSPYATAGHWVYTEYGWMWVSDYSWGWAPFHYGRWNYEPSFGWMWLPDNVWGPAWVSWRSSPGYYGWAPMGHGRDYDNDNDRWTFVKHNDIDKNDINRVYIDRSQNITIIKNSTHITNTYNDNKRNTTYVAGPGRDDVQKNTGRSVKPTVVQDNDKPGQSVSNGQMKIYRPQVQKENATGQKPAPAKVTNLHDVKSPSERNSNDQEKATQQPQKMNVGDQQKATPPANNNEQPQKTEPSDNKRNEQQPVVDQKKETESTQPAQKNKKPPKKPKKEPK